MTVGSETYDSGIMQSTTGDLDPAQQEFDKRVNDLADEAAKALEHGQIEIYNNFLITIEALFVTQPNQAAAFVESQSGDWKEDFLDGRTIQRATG